MLISKNTPKSEMIKHGNCKTCGHCCYFTSGIVLDEEIPQLANEFKLSEEDFKTRYLEEFTKLNTQKHRFKQLRQGSAPHGRCIFLNVEENKCTIHKIRPLHCKISTCDHHGEDAQKWFDVKHFLNTEDRNSVREYAIYTKLKEPLPGASLEELVPKEKLEEFIGGMEND